MTITITSTADFNATVARFQASTKGAHIRHLILRPSSTTPKTRPHSPLRVSRNQATELAILLTLFPSLDTLEIDVTASPSRFPLRRAAKALAGTSIKTLALRGTFFATSDIVAVLAAVKDKLRSVEMRGVTTLDNDWRAVFAALRGANLRSLEIGGLKCLSPRGYQGERTTRIEAPARYIAQYPVCQGAVRLVGQEAVRVGLRKVTGQLSAGAVDLGMVCGKQFLV